MFLHEITAPNGQLLPSGTTDRKEVPLLCFTPKLHPLTLLALLNMKLMRCPYLRGTVLVPHEYFIICCSHYSGQATVQYACLSYQTSAMQFCRFRVCASGSMEYLLYSSSLPVSLPLSLLSSFLQSVSFILVPSPTILSLIPPFFFLSSLLFLLSFLFFELQYKFIKF